ncbi:hypothetical protein [Acrocarpospora catenulata]|uniref:hypothetical protein n=1 Tax=Acrocarpospora catenulata TaxID=2836182 RepID=UPI001BDB06F1|nr:hypothetical protein [Acrocarpospora catenulata]
MLLPLVLSLAGCGCGEVVRREVPIPPASAHPKAVVLTYIAAVLGKDKETVRAIMVPETDFDSEFGAPVNPFRSWISASDIEVEEPYTPSACPSGGPCMRMWVSMELCEVGGGSDPSEHFHESFHESFGVRWVGDRWLVTGFGSG